jgi:hypothetical protein
MAFKFPKSLNKRHYEINDVIVFLIINDYRNEIDDILFMEYKLFNMYLN